MRDWEGEGDRNVELVTEGEGAYRNNNNNYNNNQLVSGFSESRSCSPRAELHRI